MPARRQSSKSSARRSVGDERADAVVQFIEECCVHTIGRWSGHPFKLVPWQKDFIREVFGNVDKDGLRITRRAFLAIARKQGKSELAAAVALYLLLADNEPTPHVFGAAQDRDQASLVFDVAAQMVHKSPQLREMAKVVPSTKRIICTAGPSAGGVYRAIPADAAGAHGFNASGIIFDEFHTQKNRDLYDVLSTSTSARDQPLIFMITTAGFDKNGPCHEVYEYAKSVLSGSIKDRTFVGRVFEVPQGTDFETLAERFKNGKFKREKDLWPLANPSLVGQPGGFVRPDEIRRAVTEAIHLPRARNHVLNLHFNVWTDAAESWLAMSEWDACAGVGHTDAHYKGRSFYGGLDLSHTQDLTAWHLLFTPTDDDPVYRSIWRIWVPEQAIIRRGDMAPQFEEWRRAGWLRVCPGDVVDHRDVEEQIDRDCEQFHMLEAGYDTFHAYPIVSSLAEKMPDKWADAGQTFRHMNSACKEFERMISERLWKHDGNGCARWCAGNVVAETNQDDLVRPSRKKSNEKIDPIVSALFSVQRMLVAEQEPEVTFYSFAD